MTSPHLTDQKPRIDPVEALRLLMAELQALVVRLELKDRPPGLQNALRAAQERVWGPRAVAVLLGEDEELKRRFLERLLGPEPAMLPKPTTVCTRLEYGGEPESTVTMPPEMPAAPALDPLEEFLGRSRNAEIAKAPAEAPDRTDETQAMRLIRLPNPTLQAGLAVIDTPAIESGEPAAKVLACVEQADAWILVLDADHALSEAGQRLLRRLPERGARLEIVVENADSLSGEERLAARDRLMRTLRESCLIEAPRLTLVASAATEGQEGDFWHGRFATFHSVMMLRGRERWMAGTRALVLDALSQAGAAIDIELKSIAPGVRHARLRLGMKDLDGLQTRFSGLVSGPGLLDGEPPAETKSAAEPEPAAAIPHQSRLDWSGGTERGAETADGQSPMMLLAQAIASMTPESAGTRVANREAEILEPEIEALLRNAEKAATEQPEISRNQAPGATSALTSGLPATVPPHAKAAAPRLSSVQAAEPAFVRSQEQAARFRPKRGVSVHLSGSLRRLAPRGAAAQSGTVRLLKRIAWVTLVVAFICLILWALAPRGFLFGQSPPAEWDYRQPKPALASRARPATPGDAEADSQQPDHPSALPDTSEAATPNIPTAAPTRRSGAVRTPLVHPIPSDATAGVSQRTRRHHRHLLGLDKLWHWVRHPHHVRSDPDRP